jgi:hypothetical protein
MLQDGWVQELPMSSATCASGMGYVFMLAENERAEFVDFLMRRQ